MKIGDKCPQCSGIIMNFYGRLRCGVCSKVYNDERKEN